MHQQCVWLHPCQHTAQAMQVGGMSAQESAAAVGCTAAAVGCTAAAVGCTAAAVGCTTTIYIGRGECLKKKLNKKTEEIQVHCELLRCCCLGVAAFASPCIFNVVGDDVHNESSSMCQ
jgi:hypothetical protein